MNPFEHMSQRFINLNRDDLEEALFNQVVNPPDSIGDCIEQGLCDLGNGIGSGIAWFGFWLFAGVVCICVTLPEVMK